MTSLIWKYLELKCSGEAGMNFEDFKGMRCLCQHHCGLSYTHVKFVELVLTQQSLVHRQSSYYCMVRILCFLLENGCVVCILTMDMQCMPLSVDAEKTWRKASTHRPSRRKFVQNTRAKCQSGRFTFCFSRRIRQQLQMIETLTGNLCLGWRAYARALGCGAG